MSYHRWSNASNAGRRAYESQGSRTNMSRYSHSGYQHQRPHYNYRNSMRQQRNYYNIDEDPAADNHDSSNEASVSFPEVGLNSTENGNGSNDNAGDSSYRNYFTRHRVSQEGGFRDNLQLWHTRIFTRSDNNASDSYATELGHNHCGCTSNNVKNPNHKPLYSDIAKNTFAREDYIETGRSRGNEPFTQEVAGGYIAPNVGYMSAPRFSSPLNYIPSYKSYQQANAGFGEPDTTDAEKNSFVAQPGNLICLDDFPTLSSARRIRNSSKNRKIAKKQSGLPKNAQQTDSEKASAEAQDDFDKNALDQDQQAQFLQELWESAEKQEKQQQKQLMEQQQQNQIQEAALYQFYQQQQQARKEAAQNQMQQQAHLQHMQQQEYQQQLHSHHLYNRHQQQQSQKTQQEQVHQRFQAQPTTNRIFYPANLAHQNTHAIYHSNPLKLYPDMRLTQHQQLQLRELQLQQQQQQISYLHYQQQAAQQQYQQLQSEQFMFPSVALQPNAQQQQNGQFSGTTGLNTEQYGSLRHHSSLLPSIQWQSVKLPTHPYPNLLTLCHNNADDIIAQHLDLHPNENSNQYASDAAEYSIFPPLQHEKHSESYLDSSHAADTLRYVHSQFPSHLVNFQQSDESAVKNETATCKNAAAYARQTPEQDEEMVPKLAQLSPTGSKMDLDDFSHLQSDRLSTEHFPALPKRTQLHAAQSAENLHQRYIYFPPGSIEQQQHKQQKPQQQQQPILRNTFSSILISSSQNAVAEEPVLPKVPIFKMRIEDFPELPSGKSRTSKKLNTPANSDNTQTTTETLAPAEKPSEPAWQGIDTDDVSNFLANLENHSKAQKEKGHTKKSGKYVPPKETLKVWPNNLISNIPLTMLTDQYGIAGLYSAHKAAEKDPHIARMTYGIDLETLGLDLRSKQPLLPRFKGPFAGESEQLYSNEYLLFPPKHLIDNSETNTTCNDNENDNEEDSDNFTSDADVRETLAPPDMEILSDEDLFYIFYTYVKDLLQLQAANELYNRAWVFYIKEKIWITHDPERTYQENGQFERGYYICYDHKECKCVLRFMTIDTAEIDDRPKIPPIHRDNANSSSNWSTP